MEYLQNPAACPKVPKSVYGSIVIVLGGPDSVVPEILQTVYGSPQLAHEVKKNGIIDELSPVPPLWEGYPQRIRATGGVPEHPKWG